MTTNTDVAQNDAPIRQRIDSWTKALRAKDLDGLMSHYAEDVLVFDLAPPLQFEGVGVYRKNWAEWFPTFEGPVGYGIRNLNIAVGGDVAFCRSLNRITGLRKDGENTDVWVRATVGFQKIGAQWMITHEHFSVPINMETFAGELELKP
jgi:ketosteroid isomerase-like protein